jgi:hypothetical protein
MDREEGITDDVIEKNIANFERLSERRGASRLERETFAGMALMLTLMQRDHKKVATLEKSVELLERRNIVTWVINNPKISFPILALILIDTVASNVEAVLKMIGL